MRLSRRLVRFRERDCRREGGCGYPDHKVSFHWLEGSDWHYIYDSLPISKLKEQAIDRKSVV